MKSRLAAAVTFLVLAVTALPALAKRQSVAAKAPATLRAEAKDDGASIATVKKGDMLTILGTQADWTNVQTAAGKKGWLKSAIVSEKKASIDSLNTDTTQIAAAEGTTESAIRGKGVKRRTMVVGMGNLPLATVTQIGDAARKLPQVTVIDTHSEPRTMPSSPASGVDGAHQLADAKKADLVVALTAGAANSLRYEFVDLKRGEVIGNGETASTDAAKAASDIAAALEKALITVPATTASPAAVPGGTVSQDGPGGTVSHDDCVKKCVDRSQMKAMTLDAIKADCEKTCVSPK